MPTLFHVSDHAVARFDPRPSPPGTPWARRLLVWAVDRARLAHYLLPRECPRVCWPAQGDNPTATVLRSDHLRVVAVDASWRQRIADARVYVHRLDPAGFTCVDRSAGYWVARSTVPVVSVEAVADCRAAMAALDVELRVVDDLWPLVDAVADLAEFSAIRMRNASARPRA